MKLYKRLFVHFAAGAMFAVFSLPVTRLHLNCLQHTQMYTKEIKLMATQTPQTIVEKSRC